MGIVDIRLVLRGCRSLKDKRRVLNSLKDRLRGRFNVSVAEVDQHSVYQAADLGVAQVSADARYVRGSLERVVQMVRQFRGAELSDYSIELFHQ